jgi:uncharacterized protein YciI
MILAAVTLAGLAYLSGTDLVLKPAPTFFGFLVTGKNPPKASSEEIAKYQGEHIANFKRLFDADKLTTAGPMADPEKKKRGIVVLSVSKKEEIPPLFISDPYVSKGFMDLEVYPIKIEFGKLNTSGIEPKGIMENRIVLISRSNDDLRISEPDRKAHLAHAKQQPKESGLAFYATILESKSLMGVALFRGVNDQAIDAWLAEDPLVKTGLIKAIRMPQWLSKGVL